jgi:uncharacterized lipoprotein YajG
MLRSQLPLTILLLFTGGCAFVDLNVAPPDASSLIQQSNLGRGREIVVEMPFADQRQIPSRCGMQKNGYNMETAEVNCTVPPPVWLSTALKQGLTSAGFRVRERHEPQAASAVHINGAVLQFFVEPDVGFATFTPEADISVKLLVTSASGLRAERVFYVKGTEESLVGTEDNFQKAANSGTREAVQSMVSAIATLLDRYPQLGAPTTAPAAKVSMLSRPEESP